VDKAQDAGPQSPLSFSSHSHSVPIPNADDSDPDDGDQDGSNPKFGGIDGDDQKQPARVCVVMPVDRNG
jgi:hypothetical protein